MSNTADRISINGRILDKGSATMGPTHRAFRYGDGLFESLRLIEGTLPLWTGHADRITAGMRLLGMVWPRGWDTYRLQHEILKTAGTPNARVRLQLSRSGGGKYRPETDEVEIVIEAAQLSQGLFPEPDAGLRIGTFPGRHINEFSPLGSLKTSNALPYIMAARYAASRGWDDALLLNTRGRLVESSASNIFLWEGGTLWTPKLEEGPTAGIMRRTVITLAKQLEIPLKEEALAPEAWQTAEEVWLTNAVQGIRYVSSIGDRTFQSLEARKMHLALVHWCDKQLPHA